MRNSSVRSLGVVVVAIAALMAACQGRERRALQADPLPATGTASATATGGVRPDGGESSQGDLGALPPTSSDTGLGSGSATGSSTGTNTAGLPGSGGTGTGTGLVITTQLENGQTATLQWDGKSFLGNDQWDVVPANP